MDHAQFLLECYEDTFVKQFRKSYILYEDIKELIRQIFVELNKSVTETDNFNLLKKHYTILHYLHKAECMKVLKSITDLQDFFRENNFIINAFKLKKEQMLTRLIVEESKVIITILSYPDKNECNAIYYCIQSKQINLLEFFLKSLKSYSVANAPNPLSEAYLSLKMRNIAICPEIEFLINEELVNLQFYSDKSVNSKKLTPAVLCQNAQKRLLLTIEHIEDLNRYLNVDDSFIFVAKCIAKNIFILKGFLKYAYVRIPWEEVEFYLIKFIQLYATKEKINVITFNHLDKNMLMQYLNIFSQLLITEVDIIQAMSNKKKRLVTQLPSLKRKEVITQICKNNPELSSLYSSYQIIRDSASLFKINEYMQCMHSIDPKTSNGHLVIKRTLQMMGELMKNTLESPKMSESAINFFQSIISKAMLDLIINLREIYTHLPKNSKFHHDDADTIILNKELHQEIKKISAIIVNIIYKIQIEAFHLIVTKLQSCKTLEDLSIIQENLKRVGLDTISKIAIESFEEFKQVDILKLPNFLYEAIDRKTDYEKNIIREIQADINRSMEKDMKSDFETAQFLILVLCNVMVFGKINDHLLLCITDVTKTVEKSLRSINKFTDKNNIPEYVKDNIRKLMKSVSRRLPTEKVYNITIKVFKMLSQMNPNISMIEELCTLLSNDNSVRFKESELLDNAIVNSYDIKNEVLLQEKLQDLKRMMEYSIGNQTDFMPLKPNQPITFAMEMLVLEILTLLEIQKQLTNNYLFLDEIMPTLAGKALRNHLAHHNALTEILDLDPTAMLYFNARKLIEIEFNQLKQFKIGFHPSDNVEERKHQIAKHIQVLNKQLILSSALEQGELKNVQNAIQHGGDLEGITLIERNSSLHLATCSGNLELLRFVASQLHDANWNVINRQGENLLHVALKYHGDMSTIQYLIDQNVSIHCFDVNDKMPFDIGCQFGRTDVIKHILAKDPSLKNIRENSFIKTAALNKHAELVHFLLEHFVCDRLTLTFAIIGGNVDVVKDVLQYTFDMIKAGEGEDELLPIHTAIAFGHLDIVKLLQEQGEDINRHSVRGVSIIHKAIQCNQLEIMEYLLTQGASPNQVDVPYLNMPLHNAVRSGNIKMVQCLLKHKALISPMTYEKMTPLHWAAHGGFCEIAELLISAGADVMIGNKTKNIPLHLACIQGHLNCVNLLLSRNPSSIEAENAHKVTPLHLACYWGKYKLAKHLIEKGASTTKRDNLNRTTLHMAAFAGCVNILELLLDNGADINDSGFDGSTPLHVACQYQQEQAVAFLIQQGAKINILNSLQQSPIHTIVVDHFNFASPSHTLQRQKQSLSTSKRSKIAKILIESGCFLDCQDHDGNTPLQYAIETCPDIAITLIEKGCATNLLNYRNGSPLIKATYLNCTEVVKGILDKRSFSKRDILESLNYAIELGNRDMFTRLYDEMTSGNCDGLLERCAIHGRATIGNFLIERNHLIDLSVVISAIRFGHRDFLKMLINNGLDVNTVIPKWSNATLLQNAVCDNNENMVRLLLENNADVNIRDDEGRSPFEFAVCQGNLEIVKLFDLQKVNINEKGTDDFTPLHIAAQENSYKVLKYLLNAGANIRSRNNMNAMPVHIAARGGHLNIVQQLFKHGQKIDDLGYENQSILHYAVLKDTSINIVEYLIEQGISIDARNNCGLTAFELACILNNFKVMRTLLQNGATIKSDSLMLLEQMILSRNIRCGLSPFAQLHELFEDVFIENINCNYERIHDHILMTERFFHAVKFDDVSTVKKLINQGCTINAKRWDNCTALHIASWKGYTKLVDVLLKNGANVNMPGKNNATPLHYAAKYSRFDCVVKLLKSGAIYEANTTNNATPLMMATDENIIRLLELIHRCFMSIHLDNDILPIVLNVQHRQHIPTIMQANNLAKHTIIVEAMLSTYTYTIQLQFVQQNVNDCKKCNSLFEMNRYDDGLILMKRMVEQRRLIFGPTSPPTLILERFMSTLHEKKGFFQEALKEYNRIESELIKILGRDHVEVLATSMEIAVVKQRLERNEEALKLFRYVLKKYTDIYGPDDERTENVKINMGLALHELKMFDEALHIFQSFHKKYTKLHGEKHSTSIKSLHNIALVLLSMKKCEEALTIFNKVYKLKKEVFGVDDKDTMRTLRNIAVGYNEQLMHNKSVDILLALLARQKSIFGDLDPETLITKFTLGNLYCMQGNFMNSYFIIKQCVSELPRVFGSGCNMLKRCNEILSNIKNVCNLRKDSYELLETYMCSRIKEAIFKDDVTSIHNFIHMGVDFNKKDHLGFAPVHYVARHGNVKLMRVMLTIGKYIDITTLTNKGNTVLHIACLNDNIKMITCILELTDKDKMDAFINMRTIKNNTSVLEIASSHERYDIVLVLLRYGASCTFDIKYINYPV